MTELERVYKQDSDGNWGWVTEVEAGGGGSQPGAGVVRGPFPFAFDTQGVSPLVDLPITALNQGTPSFTVAGDHTDVLTPASTFDVSGSTGNDGTYTVVGSAFGAGSTVVTVVEAIPDATVDGTIVVTLAAIGFPIYTPEPDEILLDAWFELETVWDGSTPKIDIGQFLAGDINGYAKIAQAAWAATTADVQTASGGLLYAAARPSLVELVGNQGNRRTVPSRFVTADPVCVICTTTGATTGSDPGSTQGAGSIYLVTVIP